MSRPMQTANTRTPTYPPYQADHYDDYSAADAHYPQHQQLPHNGPYLVPQPSTSYPMVNKGSFASDMSDRSIKESDSSTAIAPNQPTAERDPDFWKNLFPNSLACRLYLLTVLLETVVDLAIEADILVLINRMRAAAGPGQDVDLKVERLPVYLVIFALAHLFQLILAMDAVHARNTLQFIFLSIFNALLCLYAAIQKIEVLDTVPRGTSGISHIPVQDLTTIIAIVIAVAEIAYIALGWRIYQEFGWKVYKLLGADRLVKKMYMHYQIFVCLVKFDVFFWVGFSVQWIFLVLNKNDAEYYITIAAFPLSLLLLIIGHLAARHENKWLMISFMTGCVTACVYFVYKLYKILKSAQDPTFKPVFKTLTVFSSIALVILIITFIWACVVMRNFGAGLKFHMTKHRKAQSVSLGQLGRANTTLRTQRQSFFDPAPNPNRMSID